MNGAKAPETPSPVYQEKTVTPETLPTVIGADEGYDGLSQVTVNPDANLKSENIKYGATVFGVEGSYGRQFLDGIIEVGGGGGAGGTTDKTFVFDVDFSEYPQQLTFDYPADIPQGMVLDPTTVKCNRPDFLLPARIPEHLDWFGMTGKSPWHMFNTQRGHKPDSFPYVITPLKEYRTMEDPINGKKMGRTFTMTFDQEVVNAPDNLTAENIKAGVTIAGVTGTYEGGSQPSEPVLETVVTTPESFPVSIRPSEGYDGISSVTVHSPDNLTPENIKQGVTIAGVEGSFAGGSQPVTDPEAQFWMNLCVNNTTRTPANAPKGLLSHWPGSYVFTQKYIGPDGVDLSGVTVGEQNGNFKEVRQYYHDGTTYQLGGDIVFPEGTVLDSGSIFGQAYLKDIPVGLASITNLCNMTSFHKEKLVIPADMIPNGQLTSSISYIKRFEINGSNIKYDLPITLVLPSNLTKIQATISGPFTASGYLRLVLTSLTPPTLTSSSSISNFSAIVVPPGTLEAYQTATNWSKHAAKMVEGTE